MRRSDWGGWVRRGLVLCGVLSLGCHGRDASSPPATQPEAGTPPAPPVATAPEDSGAPAGESAPPEPPPEASPAPLPAPPPRSTPSPDPRRPQLRASYYGGLHPEGLAVGDFDGDGAPDVVLNDVGRNYESQYVTRKGALHVLGNDGHGRLTRTLEHQALPAASGRLALGDVNGDGLLDVFAGGRFATQVLLGKGGGSLTPVSYDYSLISGDIQTVGLWKSPTGRPLLWSASTGSGWSYDTSYTNLRLATYSPEKQTLEQWVPISFENWEGVALDDFNEDGLPDVVFPSEHSVYGSEATFRVFFGQGTEQLKFAPGLSLSPLPSFARVYSADFNQDGHVDLLTLAVDGQSVSVLLGTGQGSFSLASTSSLESPAEDVAVVRLDPDGLPDVVALHEQRDALTLLKGLGDGHLVSQGLLAVGRRPSAAASADLDGDGQPELLVAEADDNAVSLYTPPARPLTQPVRPITCPLNPAPDGPAPRPPVAPVASLWAGKSLEGVAGDFDSDGRMDLALALEEGGVRVVSHSRGGPWTTWELEMVRGERATSLAAGDFDGDGRTDLAGVFRLTGRPEDDPLFRPRVLWNEWEAPFTRSLDWDVWWAPSRLLAGDFNGDGRMDFAIATESDYGGASRETSLGQRQFRPDSLPDLNPSMDHPDGISDGHMTAADLDGDGTLEVLHRTWGGLNLNPTAKDGTGRPGTGYEELPSDGFFAAVDADGDGQADVVSWSWEPGFQVLWMSGDGHGSLRAAMACTIPHGTRLLAWEDLNADGTADVLSAEGDESAPTLWVMLRGPGNRWGTARPYALDSAISWVRPVDLLGDARPELAVMLRSGELRVFPTPEP